MKEGRIEDWKTGRSEDVDNTIQLNCYGLFSREHFKVATEAIEAVECNINTGRENRWRLIEAKLVIYGHTVGIIGGFEESDVAREAVEMILTGSEHSTVYRFLERKRHEQKMAKWGV